MYDYLYDNNGIPRPLIINNLMFSWIINPSQEQLVASLTADNATNTADNAVLTADTF